MFKLCIFAVILAVALAAPAAEEPKQEKRSLGYSSPFVAAPSYAYSAAPSYAYSAAPSYAYAAAPSYAYAAAPSYAYSAAPSYAYSAAPSYAYSAPLNYGSYAAIAAPSVYPAYSGVNPRVYSTPYY